jgi:hypothetical protein
MHKVDALIQSLKDQFIQKLYSFSTAELEAWHKRNLDNDDPEVASFFGLLELVLIHRQDEEAT